jgi:hypothetical protein
VLCVLDRGFPGRALVVRHDPPGGPPVYSVYGHLVNCNPADPAQAPCAAAGATVRRGEEIGKILGQGATPPGGAARTAYVHAFSKGPYGGERAVGEPPAAAADAQPWTNPTETLVLDYTFDATTGNGRTVPNFGAVPKMNGTVQGTRFVDVTGGALAFDGSARVFMPGRAPATGNLLW